MHRERQKDGNAPQQQDPERPAAPEPQQHDPAADQRRGKESSMELDRTLVMNHATYR